MERTFHQGRSELHGITVVVRTTGGELWVGRCDDEDGERVILLDADVHRDGESADGTEVTRDKWLARADRFGVWPRHRRIVIPRDRVESLERLGETPAG